MKIARGLTIAGVVAFVILIARLARLENGGPAHTDLTLPGDIPATMYLPGPGYPFYTQFPAPQEKRPPAVVLLHGFSGDRVIMSTLARRIAENGYAVLAIDFRGHGANRNPFDGGADTALRADVKAAADYLRENRLVNGSQIAVIGHSMGSGAALDFATHDPDLKGAVMISGGWTLGPVRPKNALFIFAENDPADAIRETSKALAAHLAGVEHVELGKQYGDFAGGTAVEAVQVAGANHVDILRSADAATTIVKWLDGAFGRPRTGAIETSDPRLNVARLANLIFLILLIPLGRWTGSMAAEWPAERTGPGGWIGLAILGVALIVSMPFVATIAPTEFVPVLVADRQISWFAVASLFTVGTLVYLKAGEWERVRARAGATIFAALFAFAVIYACQIATSAQLHRNALTPERLMVLAMAAALTLPFWMSFELLVRRGSTARSTVVATIGRALILALTAAGALLNVLPFVLLLVLPILAITFIAMEIFAASAYSASRNVAMIAVAETVWFAWLLASINPIAFRF
ncbi:MAG TPA: alpha/beta fold hydrolase [Candidatus Acidoferrales bacterium]|nr:alpha/beta fold hydrolase [Candidatus Acidoferrales bacterium]